MQDGESVEKLPSELLEEVATFLPLASLCRFKAVSKNWKRFISHPDFASRHARASSPEEYILISERDVDPEFPYRSWVVLDVASKRSFILSDVFLAEFVRQEEIIDPCPRAHLRSPIRRTILTANGGLMCLSYYIYHGSITFCELGTHEALLVCNPVLKTVKELPDFEGWSERPEWVVMCTDRDSMEYEIFFIHLADDASQPHAVYIYKSKTASWWTSAAVAGHLNALNRRDICCASVVLQDEFYALFWDHDGLLARLVSYNKVTGVVSDLGVPACGDIKEFWVTVQLVVRGGRLFCVIINTCHPKPKKQVSSIEIVEFIVARREYEHLTVLQGDMLDWFLGHIDRYPDICLTAVATGLANSIFLCSFAGQSVVYDLSNSTWSKYPDWNTFKEGTHFSDLFGSNLCLSLCPP